MPAILLDSVVTASTQQVAAVLGDEVIILGLDDGAYFGLRGVGARIWDLIKRPMRLRDVADVIVAEFAVDRERCERDLLAFAESLQRRQLIEVVPRA